MTPKMKNRASGKFRRRMMMEKIKNNNFCMIKENQENRSKTFKTFFSQTLIIPEGMRTIKRLTTCC